MTTEIQNNAGTLALEKLKAKYKARIKQRLLIGYFLSLNILVIPVVYIAVIFMFEESEHSKPKELITFSKEMIDVKRALEKVLASAVLASKNHANITNQDGLDFQSHVDELNENLKSSSEQMKELGKAVYANQGKIQDIFFNGRRMSLLFCGLIVVYLLKLYAGFYKYNTYLQVYYENVIDTLELLENDVSPKKFSELYKILSLKDLKIDQEKDLLENLFASKKSPKVKATNPSET